VSGDSGAVSWSQGFSYSGDTDWAWQRDIVLQVAHTLGTSLPRSSAPPAQPHGRKLDAIDANMRGHHLLRHPKSIFDLLEARLHFEKALALETESASPWAGIALSYLAEVENGWSCYGESRLALSEPAIDRALAIGPGYFLGHCAKADLLLARSDYASAQAAYRQALALHPSEAWAHARMGRVVLGLGRPEEVASHIGLALRLNPLQPRHVAWGQFVAGMAQVHLGRNEAAYKRFRKAGAADPNLKWAWLWMAAIDGLEGRSTQAAANLQRVLDMYPIAQIGPSWEAMYPEAQLHPRLEPGRARFIEGLRRAGLTE
jgi:tetratricopeptide (TPR) repeat protein